MPIQKPTRLRTIEEYEGFEAYKKTQLWIFKLEKDFHIKTNITGHHFISKWLTVRPDGTIGIPKGYSWNGCSPKLSIFDLFIAGTPDGIIDAKTMKPKTYYASAIHDALYQYFEWHDIEQDEIDQLFLDMMKAKKFKLASIYYLFVRMFGSWGLNPKKEAVKSIRFPRLIQSTV